MNTHYPFIRLIRWGVKKTKASGDSTPFYEVDERSSGLGQAIGALLRSSRALKILKITITLSKGCSPRTSSLVPGCAPPVTATPIVTFS